MRREVEGDERAHEATRGGVPTLLTLVKPACVPLPVRLSDAETLREPNLLFETSYSVSMAEGNHKQMIMMVVCSRAMQCSRPDTGRGGLVCGTIWL